jgi:hypothetical protein
MIRTHLFTSSRALIRATYDSESKEMKLMFRNGDTYIYSLVPHRVFNELAHSESAGGYFAAHIRDKYPSRKTDA